MASAIIQSFLNGLNGLKKQVPFQARKIIVDNRKDIIKILQDEQLAEGLNAKGNIVGRYAPATDAIASSSISTALGRKPRKPKIAGEPYNFEWTGEFFDRMFLSFINKDEYVIFSADSKTDLLLQKFGDILSFTVENNDKVNDEILIPGLTIWFQNQIALILR